jgi:glycosyltransferase 2 family protein
VTQARRLWPWLRTLGGAAILGVLVWRLGTGAFVNGLRVVDGWSALAALAIGLLTTVVSAWRWCLVARRLGLRLSLPGAVADCYRALFLNVMLPAGVLGDVHRAVSHGQRSGNVGRGVRAVILERFAGQVVLIVVGVVVLLSQPTLVTSMAHDLVPSGAGVIVTVIVGVGALALVVWAVARRGPAAWRRALSTGLATAWAPRRDSPPRSSTAC